MRRRTMKGRAWLPAATVSTEDDGAWRIDYRTPQPGTLWINVRIQSRTKGFGSYSSGFNPCENRLARSSDERRMLQKRPALWAAVTEALGARFGRTAGEYAGRLLSVLSHEHRERLLRELTEDERRRLKDVLEGARCMTVSGD